MQLSIAKIRLDGGTQTRESRDEETVAEYAEAMRGNATFPPVVVFHDGTDHWLADGFHRVDAAVSVGKKSIQVDVRQGTRRDAILFSVGANAAHGLKRTRADMRRAVTVLLTDEEWSHRSDRWIATQCGVSDKTVASVRKSIIAELPQCPTEPTRTTSDGREYPAKRKPKSRKPAPEPSEAEPETEPVEATEPAREKRPKLALVEDDEEVIEEPPADDEEDEEETDIAKSMRLIWEVDDCIRKTLADFPLSQLDELEAMVGGWATRLENMCNERRVGNA